MKKSLLFVMGMVSLLIFIGLRRNSAPFFSVNAYACVHDDIISDDCFSSINTMVANLIDEQCAAHTIITQLQEQFPLLKKIVISYRPLGTYITLSAYKPVCCINNAVILTESDQLFPTHMFAAQAFADVPTIAVAQDSMMHASLFVSSLLRGLPCDSENVYNLELINEHCVHFINKEQPNFTIISSLAQEKLSQLLVKCESVKQSITTRKGFDKGVKWIADTRFAHYIVAYKA